MPVMDSAVFDLLNGDLRDLIRAAELLTKHVEAHKAELGRERYEALELHLNSLEGELSALACSECWGRGAGDQSPLGLYRIDAFCVVCDDCYDRLNAKREPFDGEPSFNGERL